MSIFLDVVALVVAVVAVGFAVVAVVRARAAEDRAGAAAVAAAHAGERAEVAANDAAQAIERAGDARGDAATALDQATRARHGAAQAQANAAAAHEEAEQARADADRARTDADTATGALANLSRSLGAEGAGGRVGAGEAGSAGGGASAVGPRAASTSANPVAWELEQVKPAVWLLRNSGSIAAHSALLTDATQPPKFVRPDEVIPRDVPPGDHLQFRVLATRGGPPPRVRVMWREDGAAEPKTFDVTLLAE
ncbi:MAG: hypothetical protein ABI310_00385 [Microbacteriaceae bacterium]